MKKGLLLWSCVMMMFNVRAQTFSEWFRQNKTQIDYYTKQIAALKAYNDLLVEGYGIVRDGLQVVSDLKQGNFDLHNNYFQSLRSVNVSLQTDQAAKVYSAILEECKSVLSLVEQVPSAQQQYIETVISTLKRKANETYSEYERLTTAEQYQLTDNERMRRMDESMTALHDQYAFAKRLYYGMQKMILREAKESNDTKALHQLFEP
jgi:gamma-glutamylcysteine synthetase